MCKTLKVKDEKGKKRNLLTKFKIYVLVAYMIFSFGTCE